MKHRLLATLLVAGLAPAVHAGVIDKAQRDLAAAHAPVQSWSAWGGQIGFRWNNDLLSGLGITLATDGAVKAPVTGTHADFRVHTWFDVRQAGGIEFLVSNGALDSFAGGSLMARGGYVLTLRDGSKLDLRNATLRVRANDPNTLELVGGDGKAWFYVDRVMFQLADDNRILAVRVADLRISRELANRLGAPDAADWAVADLSLYAQVNVVGSDNSIQAECSPYPWPNVAVADAPGQVYQADLFMQATQYSPVGCQSCDGPGGNDGIASIAPSSTLRNNVNYNNSQSTIPGDPLGTSTAPYTAFVAWFPMFSGNNPPYSNDQHPFLIWNMYRIDADGSIEQIGRSGVKHAFLTLNSGCLDSCNHMNGNALGRGCGDTYATGNNDSSSDMGPRSEIVPAQGIWGRCGSIWDPQCTGSEHNNDNDSWTQRLKAHESQIDPAANPGATYMMESWYVARDDINIYNSMATIVGTPHYASGQWTLSGQSNFKLGPAVDRWVSPTAPPANSLNTEVATSEGHAKVAVKATDLGGGSWRYDYAVENLDYARAVIQAPPSGPDPRVVSNKGFDSFSVPLPAGANVVATAFRDGDLDADNDWKITTTNGRVLWTAAGRASVTNPASKPTLDWGSMYTFSVTVNRAPTTGNGTLHVATAGSPSQYTMATVVPGT